VLIRSRLCSVNSNTWLCNFPGYTPVRYSLSFIITWTLFQTITAKAYFLISLQPKMGLLAYCSTCNAFFMNLPVSPFVFHSSLLTVNLVVARDGFLCIMAIICIFHSSNFDYRGAFQIVLDSYCCNRLNIAETKRNGCFTFQKIINKTGACSTITFFWCRMRGFTSQYNYYKFTI